MDIFVVHVVRLFPTPVVEYTPEKIRLQYLRGVLVPGLEQFLSLSNIGHGIQRGKYRRLQRQLLRDGGGVRHVPQAFHHTDIPQELSAFMRHAAERATIANES